jgi:alpha-tubulin suppressor-like RCC1 family protein
VWCWGQGGSLGDGTRTDRRRAVRATWSDGSPLTGVTELATGGYHTCARLTDGSAWCWGSNWSGQLGDGTITDRLRAVRVTRASGANLSGITSVSAGSGFSCARTTDGSAWCWGTNRSGQIGDGTTTDRRRAVRVTRASGAVLSGVSELAAHLDHACVTQAGDVVWCWGDNRDGQLGDGTRVQRLRAVRVIAAWQ